MTRALALLVVGALAGCPAKRADPRGEAQERALDELERWETTQRAATDWAHAPSSDTDLGPDPIAIVQLTADRYAVALRGADAVIVVDSNGAELQREKAPRAPRDLALNAHRDALFVVGELSPDVASFSFIDGVLSGGTATRVAGAFGLAGVSADNGVVRVADSVRGSVLTLVGTAAEPMAIGASPLFVRAAAGWVASMSAESHRVVVARSSKQTVALENDGPVWGFDLRAVGSDVLVAVTQVEDHPLDRRRGSFEYIDSFLRVERITPELARTRLAEINLGEHGVIMPKSVRFLDDDTVEVIGAGSGVRALIHVATSAVTDVTSGPPGVVMRAGSIGVDPLLDALVIYPDHSSKDGEPRIVPVMPAVPVGGAPARATDSRVGEALMFTSLIAPRQSSEGGLSRFTCETCHFEGHGDGRTHDTGRMSGDSSVHATTKPLLGLANDIPLFTRALDPNLTRMVHAEFRVANANSALDPWFAIRVDQAPWLRSLGVAQATLEPVDLRRALVAFLFDFRPRTNPRVVGRTAFTDVERHGAEVFRAQCVSCHSGRLIGNDASTEVPFERWESLVLSDSGPIVWSRDGYEKTGIEPYVNEKGARPSSLRRIEKKRPYFTNGSAQTLDDVARTFRALDNGTRHHEGAEGTALSDDDQRALVAFLVLL